MCAIFVGVTSKRQQARDLGQRFIAESGIGTAQRRAYILAVGRLEYFLLSPKLRTGVKSRGGRHQNFPASVGAALFNH